MYSGFVGTVISHFCSLISTLWAIVEIARCEIQPGLKIFICIGFFLIFLNSCLAIVRYGNLDIGYKLIPYHVLTLNLSAILSFTIFEGVFYFIYSASNIFLYLLILNIIPVLCNIKSRYYRVRFKWSDIIIAINSIILVLKLVQNENYHGIALCFSYLFAYFIIGETGCIFDTELPAIDAFQYLICFLNYFTVCSFCY